MLTKTARQIKAFIFENFDFIEENSIDHQRVTKEEKESISMLILEDVFGLKKNRYCS